MGMEIKKGDFICLNYHFIEITFFLLYWTAGIRFAIKTTDSFLKKSWNRVKIKKHQFPDAFCIE